MKKVRINFNDLPTEEYLLLGVAYSPMNGMVAICERLHDGFGMKPYKYPVEMTKQELNLSEYKGKIKEIPIADLIAIC